MPSDLFSPQSIQVATDVLIKLGVAAVLGGIVGWEREIHGRPAGIRTHILMILGVVLLCEVSRAFAPNDPARIAAQIVTGIGFLGAGTIMRNGAEIHGLTSAASVWAVSAIGMAISVGGPFLLVAVAATILTLLTLNVLERIETLLVPNLRPHSLIVTLADPTRLTGLIEALGKEGGRLLGLRTLRHGAPTQYQIDIQGDRDAMMRAATGSIGVEAAHWSR